MLLLPLVLGYSQCWQPQLLALPPIFPFPSELQHLCVVPLGRLVKQKVLIVLLCVIFRLSPKPCMAGWFLYKGEDVGLSKSPAEALSPMFYTHQCSLPWLPPLAPAHHNTLSASECWGLLIEQADHLPSQFYMMSPNSQGYIRFSPTWVLMTSFQLLQTF